MQQSVPGVNLKENVKEKNPMINVFGLRDFRLLLAGAATSLLGDQLVLIATPWLVLKMTGDPLALGIILALEGIPRALFMLLGGAITDRFSPRIIMLLSDIVRFIVISIMAAAILMESVEVWMLYAFALAFGLVAGFAVPAQGSIVPLIVKEKDLQAGNSVIMGITQLAGFIGPTIAGILIGTSSNSMKGIFIAFAADAATFAISALCLWLISSGKAKAPVEEKETILNSIKNGIAYLWNDRPMRAVFFIVSAVNFFFVGPFLVGVPVLADTRLKEGAIAFGILMSAVSGGNLAGFILAGSLPKPGAIFMKRLLVSVFAGFGLFIILIGFLNSTWIDAILLAILGLGNGYIAITFFTWIQKRTPENMLGRVMSILIFANTGLIPVSQALSGVIIKIDLTALFLVCGAIVMLVAIAGAFLPEVDQFAESLAGKRE